MKPICEKCGMEGGYSILVAQGLKNNITMICFLADILLKN